ncbi:MAG: substrate-binding domain-containing protein, partial [Anaerolineae bacterium]|nr:substrate-binding domain-containing protein [Anaerolineae bacterium]
DRISADAFLPEVIRGLSHSAQAHGFKVLLEPVEDVARPDAYITLVQERRIDGIVLSGPRSDDAQLPRLVDEGFPLVLLGQLQGVRAHFVDVDNVAGARRAVEHLLALGHTRIGLITNAPLHYTASRDRLLGYREALTARGLPVDERLIRLGDFRSESGYAAMQSLLDLPDPPTAVFAASDVVAFGAVAAARERGLRIPEDIAIVGFDDVPLSRYMDPPLTTIRLPARELGARAGSMLIDLIANGGADAPQSALLPTELVVRESCGAHLRQGEARRA